MKRLMTHLYYGDISPEFSEELALKLISYGADSLEIGIPYSDPVSDGPVFQKACREAIERGITPYEVIKGIKRIRINTDKPIFLTSYFGPIYKMGLNKFLRLANSVSVSGLIIPDLPYEEQERFSSEFMINKIPVIHFATVYSTTERLKKITGKSESFIYCISLSGVTGDTGNDGETGRLIGKLKVMTDKKIYCGFGIKTAADVKKYIKLGADGVIVGSAIAEIYQNNKNKEESLGKIKNLITNIKKELK